jgi:uncharacterized protein GlcG (DUF336 family)
MSTKFPKLKRRQTMKKCLLISVLSLILSIPFAGDAFAQMKAYGAPINLETAKKAAASAIAEARKNNWSMAVAITDIAGDLVYFEKIDGTMTASVKVAMGKARSAALYKRPTKVWQDLVAGGTLFILGLEGAVPVDGGVPLVVDDKIVGAIGVSGGSAAQDGQVATAGAGALAVK